MSKKLTYKFIKEQFKKEGYTLLSKNYKNCNTKLKVRCDKGHEYEVRYSNFKYGVRCPICNGNKKLTYTFIKEQLKKEGYTLLSKKYKNANTKLKIRCDKGHEYEVIWNNFKKGKRCPYCYGNKKLSYIAVKKYIESNGYILLSKEYKNSSVKLKVRCDKGHEYEVKYSHFRAGVRCPICMAINLSIKMSGRNHYNWKGGISFEPYCEVWRDKEYKQDIRNRDSNRCLNPYCDSNNPEDLIIHHIDYNKKNCHPSNLITICRSCNIKANTNRNWHKAWYQAIMYRRYNFNYIKEES